MARLRHYELFQYGGETCDSGHFCSSVGGAVRVSPARERWVRVVSKTRSTGGAARVSLCKTARDSYSCSELSTMSCRLLTSCTHSEAPSGRKYCVPLTGSWRRRRSCCKSSLRSTKSISEVLMTRRSEAA